MDVLMILVYDIFLVTFLWEKKKITNFFVFLYF